MFNNNSNLHFCSLVLTQFSNCCANINESIFVIRQYKAGIITSPSLGNGSTDRFSSIFQKSLGIPW